jgi:hypothetical protein
MPRDAHTLAASSRTTEDHTMPRRAIRGHDWNAADRTGGPLDEILDELRRNVPGLVVERLQVTHPADDDNVYLIGDDKALDRVQIDTAPNGQPPFFIEADECAQTRNTTEAAKIILSWLAAKPPTSDPS